MRTIGNRIAFTKEAVEKGDKASAKETTELVMQVVLTVTVIVVAVLLIFVWGQMTAGVGLFAALTGYWLS